MKRIAEQLRKDKVELDKREEAAADERRRRKEKEKEEKEKERQREIERQMEMEMEMEKEREREREKARERERERRMVAQERVREREMKEEEERRLEEKRMKLLMDGRISPPHLVNDEGKLDDYTSKNEETKSNNDEDIAELPVVYSSFESTPEDGSSNAKDTTITINNRSSFSSTGSAQALIKDPFARAETEARAKAALKKARDASENVIGALNSVGSRFQDIDISGRGGAFPHRERRDSRAPYVGHNEHVLYSSDDETDSDFDSGSDVDMMLMKRENASYDSSDDEEEDATLQRHAHRLENELTMATQRCEALKLTIEATKRAMKQGAMSPEKAARSRPVVKKNIFNKDFDDYDEDEVNDTVGGLTLGFGGDFEEDDNDYLEDSLEESYEDAEEGDIGYYDDDTFAIRRAEAKLGLDPDAGPHPRRSAPAEAKSLYHQRAEAKSGRNANAVSPRILTGDTQDIEAEGEGEVANATNGFELTVAGGFDSPRIDERKEEDGEYSSLSDAVSPSARIEDRVRGLRKRCEDGLGKKVGMPLWELSRCIFVVALCLHANDDTNFSFFHRRLASLQVFNEAYIFLKDLQNRGGVGVISQTGMDVTMTPGGSLVGGDYQDEDNEEAVLQQLTSILGAEKLHFWSLVDQLLFCEDLRRNK